jgi:ketosteroid isomerase-like protein
VGQESVELITRMYDAWNGGDMAALLDVFDPEVEVRPALSTFLASPVYRGHEGVEAWYAETYEPWVQLRAEPRRFIAAGVRTVVIVVLHARVAGGRVEVESEIGHVITTRAGKIARLDGYEQPDAALAAAERLAEEGG